MTWPNMVWQIVPLLVAAAAVVALLIVPGRQRLGARSWSSLILLLALVLTALGLRARASLDSVQSHARIVSAVPHQGLPDTGYVGSAACRSCHPSQYSTWHDSFHRTMTQAATPRAVLAPFDGRTLRSHGRDYRLWRRSDEFWVRMVDPGWEDQQREQGIDPMTIGEPPPVETRVVMTTGSHHQQTYWVAGGSGRKLLNLPWVWLIDDQRWVPREDVFLRDTRYGRMYSRWNDNCIECHAVAGEPNVDAATDRMETQVAELGIACEACHGPGGEHARANRDPGRRYRLHLASMRDGGVGAGANSATPGDPTIVNPARLPAPASAQVCGQCHGLNILKNDSHRAGQRYRPGQDLTAVKMILRADDRNLMTEHDRADWPRLQAHLRRQSPTYLEDRLWPDGMVRVSGREHNALIESACFRGGELSCLSCHSMHQSDNVDQLAAGMHGDGACLQCHQSHAANISAHTHHAPGSTGSACYNCHMPHTTYGLLKGIRSHLIDSPSVAATVATGRPNACNLCHLDRTLAWTAGHLATWYRQPEPGETDALDDDERTIAAAVLWLLRGDANQRALVADRMGWSAAQEASGRRWQAPYLGHLLNDPYAAVRYIASRSLRTLPGFERLSYDFIGSPESRVAAGQAVVRQWERRDAARADRQTPEVLINPDGSLRAAELSRLARQRNDRLVDLRE